MADINELSSRINTLKSENDSLLRRVDEVRGSADREIERLKTSFDSNVKKIREQYENAYNRRGMALEQEYESQLKGYIDIFAKQFSESISSIKAEVADFIKDSEKKVEEAVELSEKYRIAAEDLLRKDEQKRSEEAELSRRTIDEAKKQLGSLQDLPVCFLAPGEIDSYVKNIKKAEELYFVEQYPSASALADSCSVVIKRQISSITQKKERWQKQYKKLQDSLAAAEEKIRRIDEVYSQKKDSIGTRETEMMDWCFDKNYTQSGGYKNEYAKYTEQIAEVRKQIGLVESKGSAELFLLSDQLEKLSEDDLYEYERDLIAANGRLDVFRNLIDQNLARAEKRFETMQSIFVGMTENGFSKVGDYGGIYGSQTEQADHRLGISASFVRDIDDVTADICIISGIDSRNVYSENVFFAVDQKGSYNLDLQEEEVAEIIEKIIGRNPGSVRHDPLMTNIHKEMLEKNNRIMTNARLTRGKTGS